MTDKFKKGSKVWCIEPLVTRKTIPKKGIIKGIINIKGIPKIFYTITTQYKGKDADGIFEEKYMFLKRKDAIVVIKQLLMWHIKRHEKSIRELKKEYEELK